MDFPLAVYLLLIDFNDFPVNGKFVDSQSLMSMRSIYLKFFWITCLQGLSILSIQAQEIIRQAGPVELSIEEITVAQGLSQGMIHGLEVDLKGYLWIATKDGLNRYDGTHFHIFRHDQHDTNSIASNYIRSLHIDEKGLIWVGTNASGLDLYDPAKAGFIHFGNLLASPSTPSFQSISWIYSDPSGKILVWDDTGENCKILIPGAGKNLFSKEVWQIKSFGQVYQQQEAMPAPTGNEMLGFSSDGALLHVHQQKLYALYPDHAKILSLMEPGARHANDEITSLSPIQYFMGDQHRLFCFSPGQNLMYKWDEHTSAFLPWIRFQEDYSIHPPRIFVDHSDRIWHNIAVTPMQRIDPQHGIYQFMDITRHHFAGTSATDFVITCEDQQHNLWAATSGNGIIKISSRNDQFIRLSTRTHDSLGIRVVRNGFSFMIHDQISTAQGEKLLKQIESNGLVPISPYTEDNLGRLWCLAVRHQDQQNYLISIDQHDLTFSIKPFTLCQQSAYENAASIMFDREGKMWIGAECINGEARLIRYDQTSGVQDVFPFPVQVIHNEHAFITDLYVDDQNVFWIGTKQGLFTFNPTTSSWKYKHVDPANPEALSHNQILSICPDPELPGQYLWIGTDGGGLNKMDIKAETFRHYTTTNGLPNNVIYAVQSDQHNKLWLSTNFGLCRFDPVNNEIWSFTFEDGLPGNEFNRLEYGKTTDGRLYFGGIEGGALFDPEVFYTPAVSSPVVINRLKLSNKEVIYKSGLESETGKEYKLPQPLEFCQKLTFPYTERMITLGFSLLDFTNPVGNKYRYKLEGFNDEWIDAGELNEAVFTNLNPGTYTFLVSGRNSDHLWSEPAKMELVIRSPWWATWWFRSIMGILVAIGIYTFYRYRLQQAMKIQHLRNRIAADLHDEIGSTLSSISLAGTVIQHKLKGQHTEVDGFLDKINYNTQKMMEAMSDIVWAVNTKNDRFEQVLHRMRAFAVEILEPKDVLVHFNVSPQLSQLVLDMQQRKNLYLVFKEVIHNSAKYAQCENVWVTLAYIHGQLIMRVRDDGVGFNVDPTYHNTQSRINSEFKSGMGGNGIQNMHQRALELKGKLGINSSPGHGTEVSLVFSV